MELLLNPFQKKRLRDRIELSINLKKLYQEIDSIPALTGAGINAINLSSGLLTGVWIMASIKPRDGRYAPRAAGMCVGAVLP